MSTLEAENRVLKRVTPKYPVLARQTKTQGTVRLSVIISTDGEVESVEAVSGPPLLVPAAIEAVGQWLFKPFAVDGKPVRVDTTIDVIFAL